MGRGGGVGGGGVTTNIYPDNDPSVCIHHKKHGAGRLKCAWTPNFSRQPSRYRGLEQIAMF